MSAKKILTPEDTPEHLRPLIRFDTQQVKPHGSSTRLYVDVECRVCRQPQSVSVNNVRAAFNGKRQLPGTHRSCIYSGRYTSKDGYILVYNPKHPRKTGGNYVAEHILVMEESLGRFLDEAIESVHHIDGDKSNNDISNLQLRKKFHGKGQAYECLDCGSHNIVAVALKD